jgi:protein disulfide-isomerase A1
LGKLDATVHKKYSEKYGVSGFPTLKFFINGDAIEYGGGRTESEIINWLRKKTQPSTTEVSSADEVEKLRADNDVVVVFFGEKDSADFETYSKVTKAVEDVIFVHSFSADLKSHFEATSSVVLFKNFDEKRNNFDGEFTSDNVKSFVETNMYPTVMEFTQKAA